MTPYTEYSIGVYGIPETGETYFGNDAYDSYGYAEHELLRQCLQREDGWFRLRLRCLRLFLRKRSPGTIYPNFSRIVNDRGVIEYGFDDNGGYVNDSYGIL